MFLMAEFTTTVSSEDVPVNKVVLELCACILVVTLGARLLLPFPASPSTAVCCGHPAAESLVTSSGCLTGNSRTVFPYSPTCPSSSSCPLDISPWSLRALLAPERCPGPGLMAVVLVLLVALYQPQWTTTRPAANHPMTSGGHVLRYLYSHISFLEVLLLMVYTP
ncbi:hypothetical protein LTLLF_166505 [Microtus ochrogaster]|uniref:Uncharacterized protein n=1 Tax=Microtus ochrogaster TaxID=79684 RepID=A0A8J6GEE7_MICOH|nr:hypothetical protein LTLLF_166505 [Microtus ochrogaster]